MNSIGAKKGHPRLLVTGFGAFPGAPSNPTLAIIARLARSGRLARAGVELVTRALPVVYDGAEARLRAMIVDTRPDAILHLGLAARRASISIETRALNRLHPLRGDARRRSPAAACVLVAGPHRLAARWSPSRIAQAASRSGAPATLSIDAGDYLCNQTLYLTLATTRVPAGFIHVPLPRGRRPVGKSARRPTLAMLVRAIEEAALALAIETRLIARQAARAASRISDDD
jgi:pyroglutamyl-peptidase